jgi:putative tryptophan/tyrosine transport system substrate-binding protein
MKRREFISVVAGAVAWPKIAQAQQRVRPWRLGFIAGGVRPVPLEGTLYDAFPQGMRSLGYVQGKDFTIEWRFAEGKFERFHGFAQELVDLNVDVIVLGAMVAVRPIAPLAFVFTFAVALAHAVVLGLPLFLVLRGGSS